MKRFLKNWFGFGSIRRRANSIKRPFRPQIEGLEQRECMSVTFLGTTGPGQVGFLADSPTDVVSFNQLPGQGVTVASADGFITFGQGGRD
jgi:hypothetical protein